MVDMVIMMQILLVVQQIREQKNWPAALDLPVLSRRDRRLASLVQSTSLPRPIGPTIPKCFRLFKPNAVPEDSRLTGLSAHYPDSGIGDADQPVAVVGALLNCVCQIAQMELCQIIQQVTHR